MLSHKASTTGHGGINGRENVMAFDSPTDQELKIYSEIML